MIISPEQVEAVQDVVGTMAGWTTDSEPATHFTCTEAESLSRFLAAFGERAVAKALVSAHAAADEEGDLHYRG